MPKIKLIAILDDKLGLSKKSVLPWDIPRDREYFKKLTNKETVVVGWNTFAVNNFKPFGDGTNIVLTRKDLEAAPGVWIVHDAKEFFQKNQEDIWVIGGGQIYEEAMPFATELYLTRVKGDYGCDVFFPEFEDKFELVSAEPEAVENGFTYQFQIWRPKS